MLEDHLEPLNAAADELSKTRLYNEEKDSLSEPFTLGLVLTDVGLVSDCFSIRHARFGTPRLGLRSFAPGKHFKPSSKIHFALCAEDAPSRNVRAALVNPSSSEIAVFEFAPSRYWGFVDRFAGTVRNLLALLLVGNLVLSFGGYRVFSDMEKMTEDASNIATLKAVSAYVNEMSDDLFDEGLDTEEDIARARKIFEDSKELLK
jgi:hypothetical protein